MERLNIIDTTLRDGEQTAGVKFSIKQKIDIAKRLDELGVDIIEAGIPIMGKDEAIAVNKIINLDLNAKILTWNRMNIKDIKSSIDIGSKDIHISIPVSDLHIEKKLNMTREEVLDKMKLVINYAINKGCTVSIGGEDASRADEKFLLKLFREAVKEGATRIRYADTVSVLDPFTTYEKIKELKEKLGVEIDFHGHNDFGLGTANALGAFKAGASYISCSVNGLGERAGNTPLEEIVLAIKYMCNSEININIDKIFGISKKVEQYSKRKLHKGKPIVGEEVFSHESGIHVDGLIKDASTYEYLCPAILGRERKIVFGKHSGTSFYQYKLREKGIFITKEEVIGRRDYRFR